MEENKVPEEGINNSEDVTFEPSEEMIFNNKKAKARSMDMGKEIFEWVQAIVVAFVIAMFIRTFIFTMVYVDGQSMEPTLHNAERMVVSRLNNDSLEYGDVVIFRPKCSPDTPYVKRVIATEGQEVSFDYSKGLVLVNGVAIDEPYIKDTIYPDRFGDYGPYGKQSEVVPENCIFVMGDNRNNSKDSRWDSVGMVSLDDVIGKAVLRVWPVNKFGTDFKIDK